tara:strand:+ start:3125 stop:4231 length:1107 start_codon:yes stop_codon:yes gene_type:complete
MINTNNNPFHKRQGQDKIFNSEMKGISLDSPSIKGLISKEKTTGILVTKTMNQCIEEAKKTPTPDMLFDEFWYTGEICILFSDSNTGKSVLAYQIGESIASGKEIEGFRLQAEKQPVLYCDFELSEKQVEIRYSIKNETENVLENHYLWNDNFKRAELCSFIGLPDEGSYEDILIQSIEDAINVNDAKIVIIDNITFLISELEKSKTSVPLMRKLKEIKIKYHLSMLVLAHTPKRDLSQPITQNQIHGSKMLANFTDSAFAIGASNSDKNIRYIKQIKVRNSQYEFDSENVAVCVLEKPSNFLGFKFLELGNEREHLKTVSSADKEKLEFDIIELHKTKPELSGREIARRLGTNAMKVNRTLKKQENE